MRNTPQCLLCFAPLTPTMYTAAAAAAAADAAADDVLTAAAAECNWLHMRHLWRVTSGESHTLKRRICVLCVLCCMGPASALQL
jgi:hypothetical protein